MSTHGFIARPIGRLDEDCKPVGLGWEGRYHHFDAYPDDLGWELWRATNEHFDGDLNKAAAFLIDEHKAGWSSVVGSNWNAPAGYGGPGPQCYCHGERDEPQDELITERNAGHLSYGYLLYPDVGAIVVLTQYDDPLDLAGFGPFKPMGVIDLAAESGELNRSFDRVIEVEPAFALFALDHEKKGAAPK